MIRKYTFGNPFQTDAVVEEINSSIGILPFFQCETGTGIVLTYSMEKSDIVYGLGENIRGINKRGFTYTSNCSDDPSHTEDKSSLYGAHNFLIVDGNTRFGLFIDCPETITYDVGFTHFDLLNITIQTLNVDLYIIEEDTLRTIVTSFRKLIGESYIPPKWGLGYQQSRWGYQCEEDIYNVADQYEKNNIPLEAIYLDIDYMERYKDFTVDTTAFPHFEKMVSDMKERGIKLVPIIDAGVKIEEGYSVYEEGIENHYFCTKKDGTPFILAVWPGRVHLPDVMNPEARAWFGKQYQFLTDKGIEGFWNDMNEPAIFYTEEGLEESFAYLDSIRNTNIGIHECFGMKDAVNKLSNNPKDYDRFYHHMGKEEIVHSRIHNLYGYYMTRAASEGFDKIDSMKRFLLFSRSSSIGMHRYGGIWTGDNCAWWQHLLLNIKMMPSLNMCGFLYCGADIGGFGCHTSYDLMVRWLQFGIFTPLMRNHAALGTREQELYQFHETSYLSKLIQYRYSLIPYIYSEYMKAAKSSDMLFLPFAFEFPNDQMARGVEDQLLYGESLMIAPVYTQNATGRYVYLPEDMLSIIIGSLQKNDYSILKKGHHFISLSLEEFPLFVRKNHMFVLCKPSANTQVQDSKALSLIGYADGVTELTYDYYDDDGYTKQIDLNHITTIFVKKEDGVWKASSNDPTLTFYSVSIFEKE